MDAIENQQSDISHNRCLSFYSLEILPNVFTEYYSYHSQIRKIFKTLKEIDTVTACDPPIEYRLYRLRNMIQNPTIVSVECNVKDTGHKIPTDGLIDLFRNKPDVKKISKGQLELLDSKRQPLIFVCPIRIRTRQDDDGDILKGHRSDEINSDKGKGRLGQDALTPGRIRVEVGERAHFSGGIAGRRLPDDQGYESLPSSLSSLDHLTHESNNGSVVPDYIRNQIKRITRLALGCVADEDVTSVLFLVTSDSKNVHKEELITNVKVVLRDIFPNIYGNRSEDPNVHVLDSTSLTTLDKLFLNVLKKNLIPLKSSVDMLQKDFSSQDTGEQAISNDRLEYISKNISAMLVPEEEHLIEIAQNTKQKTISGSGNVCISYSDFLRQKIVSHVFENIYIYIDREFSVPEKTTISRTLEQQRRQISTKGIPDWKVPITFVVLFLTVEIMSMHHFGLVQSFCYGFIFICLFVQLETSFVNINRVVMSVQKDLQRYREDITQNILKEHKRLLTMTHCPKETIFKVRIQIKEMLEDLGVKKRNEHTRVRGKLKQTLLSIPHVVGFGVIQDKLVVHVSDETKIEDVKCYLATQDASKEFEVVIALVKVIERNNLQPGQYHSNTINSNAGLIVRNCQGVLDFILPRNETIGKQDIKIYFPDKTIKARYDKTMNMENFRRTNFYDVTVYRIDHEDVSRVEESEIHECNSRDIEQEFDINERTVKLVGFQGQSASCIVFAEYVYKHTEATCDAYSNVFLMTPLYSKKKITTDKLGTVYLKNTGRTKELPEVTLPLGNIVGLYSRDLIGFPFPTDGKVDLGKEAVLVAMPYPHLLNFLHTVCCNEDA